MGDLMGSDRDFADFLAVGSRLARRRKAVDDYDRKTDRLLMRIREMQAAEIESAGDLLDYTPAERRTVTEHLDRLAAA